MPLIRDPVVTIGNIRLRKVSISCLDLDVMVRVGNPNPLTITLRELPFTVLCASGDTLQQLAAGNTGPVEISANGTTPVQVTVRSRNAALITALAAFVTNGGVQVTIRGEAVVDAVLFCWPVPFEKTVPVTMELVAGSLAGEKAKEGNKS